MTIEEIVERERDKALAKEHERGIACLPKRSATEFGHAVATAVTKECAKVAEACEEHFEAETPLGTWMELFRRRVSRTIRALAAQGLGGEKGR